MKDYVIHKAASRGFADHLWLQAKHTFSFASYHNPDRMGFGVLRVLNDDIVSPGKGFAPHPHENMEIITIPLDGALEHSDDLGNTAVVRKNDIQVMSAGTGVMHREYNKSNEEFVKLLQIWVYPNKRNVAPRYQQITLNEADRTNKLQQILSPDPADDGVWIYQNAWFHLGLFTSETSIGYRLKKAGNGVYVFIISGSARIGNHLLEKRDGIGLWNLEATRIAAMPKTEILVMEIPMKSDV
jgi:redox-sensitive bicupin YhaK (pirin superfamily)